MSKSGAFYNEFDPKAAAWLRELIKRGLIADGEVDERSIVDVSPDELRGFTQCHFFAGIGVWSYALRSAGWADDRQVWTGSCPCQPFSAAGAGGGFDDERHLWPHWHHLISQCQPAIVFGEQVASKDGLNWLDLVHADLEATGYAVGAADMCAAGLGAPHIRQRLWFVGERLADTPGGKLTRLQQEPCGEPSASRTGVPDRGRSDPCGLGNANGARGAAWLPEPLERQGRDADVADHRGSGLPGPSQGQPQSGGLADAERSERGEIGLRGLRQADGKKGGRAAAEPAGSGDGRGLADATGGGHQPRAGDTGIRASDAGEATAPKQRGAVRASNGTPASSPTDGFWRDADWLFCRDGKWRPVEARAQPMVDGSAPSLGRGGDIRGADDSEEKARALALGEIGHPLGKDSYARVARLRGYGNAIAAPVAQAFIESVMEITQ